MVASAALFVGGNGIIKLLSNAAPAIPPVETLFFRAVISMLILLPTAWRMGFRATAGTRRLKLHLGRGALQAASMACFFTGLATTPLVEVNALEFTYPIFATVLAVAFFGERIRLRRLLALAAGFAGAMIALRPGFQAVGTGQIFILTASLLWGGVALMIRELSKSESAVTQSIYLGLVLVPVSFVMAAPVWVWPNLLQLGLLAVIGTTATLGQLLYAEAFRRGEMGAVLPLDFSKLGFSAVLGWAAFGEIPDVVTVIGAAIIFGAGAYITIREAQIARAERAA